MTPDPLDDLLERSAPATSEALEIDVRAMIGAARREAAPPRRRRPRVAIGAALGVLLVGGAGVAVATDGLTWAPWAQDPVGAVSFTMSSGLDCELRFSEYTGGTDAAFLSDVNRALEDFYRTTDVAAAAGPLLPAQLAEVEAMAAASEGLDPGSDMSALSPEERTDEVEHRAWAREWLAWELVVSDLEGQALTSAGFSVPDDRFVGSERAGQIQCFDESGDLYVPGAGS